MAKSTTSFTYADKTVRMKEAEALLAATAGSTDRTTVYCRKLLEEAMARGDTKIGNARRIQNFMYNLRGAMPCEEWPSFQSDPLELAFP